MRKAPFMIIALPLVFAFMCPGAENEPQHAITERVDRRYNSLNSLRVDFVETYRGVGAERSESGTLWLKKPGKMRWEYEQPNKKFFISDGSEAIFYVVGEPQARRAKLKQMDDLRSPLRYLLGKTKLEKEFDQLVTLPDRAAGAAPGDIVLQGVPRGMSDRITKVTLEIDAGSEIVRLVIEQTDGSQTEFRFSNLQPDVKVNDDLFRFILPPGVQWIEGNDLAP